MSYEEEDEFIQKFFNDITPDEKFIQEIFGDIKSDEEYVLEHILKNVQAKIEAATTQRGQIANMRNSVLMARSEELEDERYGGYDYGE